MTNADDVTTSSTVVLPLAATSSRLGISVDALRSRIRRGMVTARRGNDGRLLVAVPAEAPPRHDLATTSPNDELLAELDQLREEREEARIAIAKAEAGLDAAAAVAEARISAARAETKAVRELADRLTHELLEARRPWWQRLFGTR